MIKLRPAVPADSRHILDLWARYYGEEGYDFDRGAAEDALAQLLGNEDFGRLWVADHEGDIVGYAVVTFGFSLEYGGADAFVDDIYILAEHRNQGLAGQALQLIEEACITRGVRALHLEVERHKDTPLGLYRRRGFRDHDRFLLTKDLIP